MAKTPVDRGRSAMPSAGDALFRGNSQGFEKELIPNDTSVRSSNYLATLRLF